MFYDGQVVLGLSMTATAISQSGALAPDSGKAKAGAASIFALLHQKADIDSSSNSGARLENMKGEIVFQHVSFGYPSRPGVQIFTDLCFTFHSAKVNIYVYSYNLFLFSNYDFYFFKFFLNSCILLNS